MTAGRRAHLPSQVDAQVGWFDRFATAVANTVSKAWFFSACLLSVALWVPSLALFRSVDTWQLVINTGTTIVTYLLVALLQNTTTRATNAAARTDNAHTLALLALLDVDADAACRRAALAELRAAVGVEERESTS